MIRRCVLGLAFVMLATPALAEVPVLVDVDWLAQNLSAPRTVVLHRGRNYAAKHIPGARELGQGPVTLQGLASLGVSSDSHVVLYSVGAEIPAPLMFELDSLGLDNVSLLNGGLIAWEAAKKPTTTEVPHVAPGTLRAPTPRNLIVDAEFVKSIGQRQNHTLVDARAPVYYLGLEGMHGKAGHIPGAVNIPHGDFESGTLDRAAIEKAFRAAGIRPGDTVVAYCHVGQYGRWVVFAARVLGHPVRLYAGSFHDWTMNDRGPVVK
jgi:thiosulfate/3-mercaptopyruvate sulfurtransferase